MTIKIGIISDTHGLLRPKVIDLLTGADIILHAGDVVSVDIIDELQKIAPVYAVRGNCDYAEWGNQLPKTQMIEVGKATIYVLHNIYEIDSIPCIAGASIVISGHTHQPAYEEKWGIHYLNPGSCGPRRFQLPISMAIMELEEENCQVHMIDLESPEESKTFPIVIV